MKKEPERIEVKIATLTMRGTGVLKKIVNGRGIVEMPNGVFVTADAKREMQVMEKANG